MLLFSLNILYIPMTLNLYVSVTCGYINLNFNEKPIHFLSLTSHTFSALEPHVARGCMVDGAALERFHHGRVLLDHTGLQLPWGSELLKEVPPAGWDKAYPIKLLLIGAFKQG